ncbi:beta strand repeat-containing protein [Spirosoma gilvum]
MSTILLKRFFYLWPVGLLLTISTTAWSQTGIRYSVKLLSDGITYQVSLSSTVSFTGADQQTNSAQVTIVAPANSFTVNSLSSVNGTWANNTTVRVPSQNTSKDYFIFGLTNNGVSIPYTANTETILFTFRNTGSCAGAIEVWESTDPFKSNPPVQPINVGNDLTGLGFTLAGVSNAWLGNYGVGGANCSLLPVVAILSPSANSLTNLTPTVSGTVTANSSVTLTAPGGQSCVVSDGGTGNWSCNSLALTAGPVTLTAVARNSVGPSNTATVSFTAVAPPTIAITTPALNAQTNQSPIVSGTATPGASVTVSSPNGSSCVTTADGSGNWSCSSITVPAGPVTLTAIAGNVGGKTSTTTTFTAIVPPTIAIQSPTPGTQISNSPTVSGTATPSASVTLLGPNSQSCVTTANASTGAWSCSSFALPAGPVTLTATASNIGGTATTTASYSVLTTLASCGQTLNFLSSFTATAPRTVDGSTVQVLSQPATGYVYVNSDGTIRFQPSTSAAGTATFTLQAASVSSTSYITSSNAQGSGNLGCALCSGNNLSNLTSASTNDFATIDQTLALNGTYTVRAKLNGTALKGDLAGFVIGNSGLLSVSTLPTLVIQTYLSGSPVESYTVSSLANIQILNSSRFEISFPTTVSNFDEVALSVKAGLALLGSTDVYYGFAKPKPQYQSLTFSIAFPANLCTDVLSQTACPQSFSVLANDIPTGSGIIDPTTVTIVSQPGNGTATANANGTINFRPSDPGAGTASFTYQVCTKVDPTSAPNNTTVGVSSSGFASAACVGCSITSVSAVGDASLSNNATITTTVGVSGYGYVRAKLSRMAPAGDFAGFVVENTSLVQVTLINSLTVVTYKGGVIQESVGTNALLNVSVLSANKYKVRFQATKEFDEIEIRAGALGSVGSSTNIYYGFAEFGQTCTVYNTSVSFPAGMAYQCPGAFAFGNCATSTVSGTLIVGFPSSGTLTFPLTVNLAGTTSVSVTGSGITGVSTQTILSGQTSFTLPFSYDGSSPRGVRSLTVTSAEATGSCSTTVLVHVMPTVAINSPTASSQTNLSPTVSGTVTTGASVTILAPGGQFCTPTVDGSGNWSCNSLTLPAGPVTLTAVAVNEVGSATATTTFIAVAPPTIAIDVPAPNSLTSLTPLVSGTVTAGASVTLLAPGGQSCIPTVVGTSWSCNSLTLTAGPVTLTAVASNIGGTTTTTTTFTAINPPTIAIQVPAPNSLTTLTPLVSGTVTAGASVTLLAPGGQTCNPTVVGTSWSCSSLVLTEGPVTLTAIASNIGGTATTTTTFTAVAPPTIVINTPAANSTTYLYPVVSGTATPNSSVTVVAPGNVPCVVSVSGAGSWSCTSLTLTPGTVSVTALVTTIGGSASAVTSFTVVAPPCTTPSALTLTPSSISLNIGESVIITAQGGSPGVLTWSVSPTSGISPLSNGTGTSTASLTFAIAGSYTLSYTATNSNQPVNCASPESVTASTTITVTDPLVVIRPKVFLGGAYDATTGLMRDNLREKNLLPLIQPYSSIPLVGNGFTHVGGGGNESTTSAVLSTTGANAIVDWVFVELRSPSSASTVIATQSALVQRDGDVVDADGTSPLSFSVGAGNYYVVIRHRNHLGVATLNTLALSSTVVTVDFTALAMQTYGTNAQRIINSKQVLWPGNTNGVDLVNGKRRVIYQGNNNDLSGVFSQVLLESGNLLSLPTYIVQRYQTGDVNLDGEIRYQGPENDLQTIFSTVILYSALDVTYDITYIVQEQIP